jgi:predicted polyphosphate/ATP-dependent NAD kinase
MTEKVTIGFLVNPIAGMGGRVGLKGTDGKYDDAVRLGAKPVAKEKAVEALKSFIEELDDNEKISWITCKDSMGEDALHKVGLSSNIVYHSSSFDTLNTDTFNACRSFLQHHVDLIVFCGGDGTAHDIVSVVKKKVPILGIPSGVKMHSGVFGVNARATGKMIHEFIQGSLSIGDVEIMDLDEELYRKGIWKVKLLEMAKGIVEPMYVQVGKMSFATVSEDEIKDEIADHIDEEMKQHPDVLYLFGSGGTLNHISKKLGIKNTLLGIDAVYNHESIGEDLNEKDIMVLLQEYKSAKLVVSPIGAQGFILGRGNLQISPEIIKKVGIENIIVVATPAKLLSTPFIRVDTGDADLDKEFVDFEMMMVVIGFRLSKVVKIQRI